MIEHNYGDLKIFKNEYNLKPFYGSMWISYNGKYGIGFWQQVTNNYTSVNNLKRHNKKFKHIDFI